MLQKIFNIKIKVNDRKAQQTADRQMLPMVIEAILMLPMVIEAILMLPMVIEAILT